MKKIPIKPLFDSETWAAVGETVNVIFVWLFQIMLMMLCATYLVEGYQSEGTQRWELTAHAAAVLLVAWLFKRYLMWNVTGGGVNPSEPNK